MEQVNYFERVKGARSLWCQDFADRQTYRSYCLSEYIHSRLSSRSTASGSSTWLVSVCPTKVKARKSFLFTEGTPEVEIKTFG